MIFRRYIPLRSTTRYSFSTKVHVPSRVKLQQEPRITRLKQVEYQQKESEGIRDISVSSSSSSSISEISTHHDDLTHQTNGIPHLINGELHWIPKYFQPRTPNTSPSANVDYDDDHEWNELQKHLPPPPSHNLNPSIPSHLAQEKEILALMDKHLHKWDILRVPVWTNQKWFDYFTYGYMGIVALCVIFLGRWDDLNEGELHVFSGIRHFVFGYLDEFMSVSDEQVSEEARNLLTLKKKQE